MELEKLPEEVTDYPAIAMELTVSDQKSFGVAGEAVKTLKGFKKQITDYFGPMKKKAHEAHKEISTKEKEALAPLVAAEELVRGRINTFLQAEERKRVEVERKARLKAEEEERKKKARLEKRAETALAAGKDDKADALLEEAEDMYVAPVETVRTVAPVKVGGVHVGTSTKFVVEVLDLPTFIKALCDQGSAMTMLKVEQAKLVAWAKANGFERFPGLRIEKTKVANIR